MPNSLCKACLVDVVIFINVFVKICFDLRCGIDILVCNKVIMGALMKEILSMRRDVKWFGGSMLLASAVLAMPADAAVVGGTGGNSLALQNTVNFYRSLVGVPNNGNAVGPIVGGRREINWDAAAVPFNMPGDFFNTTVTRGAVLSTPGDGFVVSDPLDNADPGFPDKEFDTFDVNNTIQFATFSASRLFSPTGSTTTDIHFFVPGTNTPGVVSGFGAVFADVDILGETKIEYFDVDGGLLETVFLTDEDGGLSFGGLTRSEADVFKVSITSGNANLDDGAENVARGLDVVVMDDFIYSEPVAIPEPISAMVLGVGGLALMYRRRS